MCVLKKPSTPSFGIKLFVSLVLLAISLCLVTCVEESSEESKPAAPVKPTFLKKDVTISKADFVGLVNENPKLFYQLSEAELTTRIGNLTAAVSNTTPRVLGTAGTPAPLKAYSVAGTDPSKTEFHFILPKGKLVKDLLESNKTALRDEFLKGNTEFQTKLKSVLEDTTAFVSTSVTPGKIATSATITLKNLEDHLLSNYSLNADMLQSGTPSTPYNDKKTLLFAPIGDIKKIGLKVYIPRSTVKEFLDTDCGFTWVGTNDDVEFMKAIIGKLLAPPTPGSPLPTEVPWADVLEEAEKFGYDTTHAKMTRDDGASATLPHFEYKSISNKAGVSFEGEREKFRVSFNKIPEGLDYQKYLANLTTGITGTGADADEKLRSCFAQLVTKANEDASFNSVADDLFKTADIEDKSITYEELMTELKTLLKDIQFEFDIAVGDFKEPAADNKRFSYDSAEDKLKLLQLSHPEEEKPTEDKKFVEGLVAIAKNETEKVVYHSKVDAINAFFLHCWNAEVYDNAMKAKEEGEESEEGKGPADKKHLTGDEGDSAANQTSGNTNTEEEEEKNKPNGKTDYTIVIIIVSVVGGGLLLGVIAFIFIKKQKHESNEASA